MPKLRGPLLSLGATGGLTKLFSLARRMGRNIIERKPMPTDAKSPAQLFSDKACYKVRGFQSPRSTIF